LGSHVSGFGREAVVGFWEYLVTDLETGGTHTVCVCVHVCLHNHVFVRKK